MFFILVVIIIYFIHNSIDILILSLYNIKHRSNNSYGCSQKEVDYGQNNSSRKG